MHIPGHLAVALLEYRLVPPTGRGRSVIVPLLAASLFPDLVDKAIRYIFRAMPNGRHYAHNLFSLAGVTALVALVGGKKVGLAWFGGYAGHLLADANNMVPWFFPLVQYPFKPSRLRFRPGQLFKETLLLGLALALLRRDVSR